MNVGLQGIVDFDLNELFQRLILFRFQFNVVFLWNEKLMCPELLLVELQLFLEGGKLIDELLLGILELTDNLATAIFLLLESELEVGSLGLKNLRKLALLHSQLVNLFLQLGNPLAELLLLGG